MLAGFAIDEQTAAFANRFPAYKSAGFYRLAQGLTLSSVGIGSYLGGMDDATDAGYSESIAAALRSGINVVDTSLNYRNQRSERAIGRVITEMVTGGEIDRREFLVCTKAGYLVPDAIPNLLHFYDVVGKMHAMTPAFLIDQLERSRRNLNLETIDVFYVHNPETQLGAIPRELFEGRLRAAFEALEQQVAAGRIRFYGTATWDGYRRPADQAMSLARLDSLAREVGGPGHHFRFVQLPYNLAMPEAFTLNNQAAGEGHSTLLRVADSLGITVIASASLLQARLARNLPETLSTYLGGLSTDAQRALQFTRSAPGITTALVGMSSPEHVRENLGVASVPPLAADSYAEMFTPAR